MFQPKDTDWLDGYKKKTIHMLSTRPTSDLETHRMKVRGWRQTFHASGNKKKSGVVILISHKIDLNMKNIIRGH